MPRDITVRRQSYQLARYAPSAVGAFSAVARTLYQNPQMRRNVARMVRGAATRIQSAFRGHMARRRARYEENRMSGSNLRGADRRIQQQRSRHQTISQRRNLRGSSMNAMRHQAANEPTESASERLTGYSRKRVNLPRFKFAMPVKSLLETACPIYKYNSYNSSSFDLTAGQQTVYAFSYNGVVDVLDKYNKYVTDINRGVLAAEYGNTNVFADHQFQHCGTKMRHEFYGASNAKTFIKCFVFKCIEDTDNTVAQFWNDDLQHRVPLVDSVTPHSSTLGVTDLNRHPLEKDCHNVRKHYKCIGVKKFILEPGAMVSVDIYLPYWRKKYSDWTAAYGTTVAPDTFSYAKGVSYQVLYLCHGQLGIDSSAGTNISTLAPRVGYMNQIVSYWRGMPRKQGIVEIYSAPGTIAFAQQHFINQETDADVSLVQEA